MFYKPNQEAQLRAVGKRAVCIPYDSIQPCTCCSQVRKKEGNQNFVTDGYEEV